MTYEYKISEPQVVDYSTTFTSNELYDSLEKCVDAANEEIRDWEQGEVLYEASEDASVEVFDEKGSLISTFSNGKSFELVEPVSPS